MKRFLPAVAALVFAGCTSSTPAPAAKEPPAPTPSAPVGFPDTPTGRAAEALLVTISAAGSDAETRHQQALSAMRALGDDAVAVLAESYRSAPKPDDARRQVLVASLAALEMPAALPRLTDIAREPMPEPVKGPAHAINPYLEEAMIRVLAVQGIGRLAGAKQAPLDVLFELLKHPALPVREEASRALTSAAARLKLGAEVLDRIPQDLRFELRPRDAEPIPPKDADPNLRPKSGGVP